MEQDTNEQGTDGAARHSGFGARPLIAWGAGTLILILVIFNSLGVTSQGGSGSAIGSTPDFTLNDLSNAPVHLADFRGHPVLLNAWASWCPPCRAEIPDLIRYYRGHVADGLVVLAVNTSDQLDSARQYAAQSQMPFPVLFDGDGTVSRLLGVDGLPSTFLLDRNGQVRFVWTGQLTQSVLDQKVTPLLNP